MKHTIDISFSGTAEEIGRLLISLDQIGFIDLDEAVPYFIQVAMQAGDEPLWVKEWKRDITDNRDFQLSVCKEYRRRRAEELNKQTSE